MFRQGSTARVAVGSIATALDADVASLRGASIDTTTAHGHPTKVHRGMPALAFVAAGPRILTSRLATRHASLKSLHGADRLGACL
jgi:hypothetical protein